MRCLLIGVLTISILNFTNPLATAEECDGETCISVTADDDNHLVIRVRKGSPGSISATSPTPRPSRTSSSGLRKPWIPWLPKAYSTINPRPTRSASSRPVTRKPKVRKISSSAIADQVSKMLPSGLIITQPTAGALVREPVNFLTTVPKTFQTVLIVLEVPIHISLQASYQWNFGDGTSRESTLPGAPYPAGTITHVYENSGEYTVELRVTWSGTWRAGAISGPINGSIRQNFGRNLKIYPADTRIDR